MTASATGLRVFAGPIEATTIGNAVAQLIAAGELSSVREARNVITDSFPVKEYTPEPLREAAYETYAKITNDARGQDNERKD